MRQLSRRELLKLGASCAAGVGMPGLPARRALGDDAFTPWVLLVYASGGWDPTMVFDDKVGVGQCAQEAGWRSAKSKSGLRYVDHPDRPSVKEFFDAHGANAAIINGFSCGAMSWEQAVQQTFGAVPDQRFRRCDWLSFYAAYLNPGADLPHVVIDAPYMPGEFAPHAVKLTTAQIAAMQSELPNAAAFDDDNEGALAKLRKSAFQSIAESPSNQNLDGEKLLALYYNYLRNEAATKRLAKIDKKLGERPDDESDFVRNGKRAVELFAGAHSQCVTLQAGADLAWNTTTEHFSRQSALYEDLFAGLNAIFAYADERGVRDKMIVIVMSERGRSPAVNARDGKDAWPFSSALLWGVGIAGGKTTGRTDALLRGLPINPVFGSEGDGAITIEMAHVMIALYLKASAPGALFLPQTPPLSAILASD